MAEAYGGGGRRGGVCPWKNFLTCLDRACFRRDGEGGENGSDVALLTMALLKKMMLDIPAVAKLALRGILRSLKILIAIHWFESNMVKY